MIGTAIWAAAAMMAVTSAAASTLLGQQRAVTVPPPASSPQVMTLAEPPPPDLRRPSYIVSALRQEGYRAELRRTQQGEPVVLSATNGRPFTVIFYGCDGFKDCKSFGLRGALRKEAFFTPVLANEWNAEHRFLRIAIDANGDLQQYLDATGIIGMTQTQFAELLVWYTEMDRTLARFLAEKRDAAKAATPAPAPTPTTASRRR